MTRRSIATLPLSSTAATLNAVKGSRILSSVPIRNQRRQCFLLAIALALWAPIAHAQAAAPQPSGAQPASQPAQSEPLPDKAATPGQATEPAAPSGKVLFSRDTDAAPGAQPATPDKPTAPNYDSKLEASEAERNSLTFTAYDLDLHLTPAVAGISVRAGLTIRNDGAVPLPRLILQISSSLSWDAFSTRLPSSPGTVTPLTFAVHLVDTDADHTGRMQEAAVTLPQPLVPGASITLTALYSGAIPVSTNRLTRIGAPTDQALSADWDAISGGDPSTSATSVALRGFGNVLWVPVSSPPLFLGDAARLFQAVGNTKLRESTATIRLRVAVEYVGDAPDAAYFCGRREQLIAISDNPNMPAAESPGIATAIFAPRPLGFRTPNLFITANAATETGTPANPGLIAAIAGPGHSDSLPAYAAAATLVEPLLIDWLGAQPDTALTIVDHPGQPFEDDAVLVRPMRAEETSALAPSLAHSLTHAWIHSSHPWIDEGLAQFLSLLWTERTTGRDAALAELQEAARTLALAEPENPDADPSSSSSPSSDLQPSSSSTPSDPTAVHTPFLRPAGESLAAATGDVFYRTKAAAVWWMLRSIVGDNALKQALQAYRQDAKLDRDPAAGFEHTLEKTSHKDLRWFFNDWVYLDRGLPDLSIENVTPSQIDTRSGAPAGWLVAVVVHNDGYAEAEVPVTVRSGTASQTTRLRIPGRSSVSTRIVFAGTPTEVDVNDGGVPETQASVHTRQLILPGH